MHFIVNLCMSNVQRPDQKRSATLVSISLNARLCQFCTFKDEQHHILQMHSILKCTPAQVWDLRTKSWSIQSLSTDRIYDRLGSLGFMSGRIHNS